MQEKVSLGQPPGGEDLQQEVEQNEQHPQQWQQTFAMREEFR